MSIKSGSMQSGLSSKISSITSSPLGRAASIYAGYGAAGTIGALGAANPNSPLGRGIGDYNLASKVGNAFSSSKPLDTGPGLQQPQLGDAAFGGQQQYGLGDYGQGGDYGLTQSNPSQWMSSWQNRLNGLGGIK